MEKKLLIIGAGGHAKTVIDCVDSSEFEIVGLLDKDEQCLHKKVNGVEIVGTDAEIANYFDRGIRYAFIAIGHLGGSEIRRKLFFYLKKIGFQMINIIHPYAYVSKSSVLGEGNLIMPCCVINAEARLGNNNIINTGAIIEHEVGIGNDVHIAPGTIVCGQTIIGDDTFIGARSVLIQGIKIGTNVIVGAGSTVLEDVPDNQTVIGSPAKVVRRKEN